MGKLNRSKVAMYHGNKQPLPLPTYQFWYDVIKTDNTREYRRILDESVAAEQQRLIDGCFLHDCDDFRRAFDGGNDVMPSLPVSVACAHGSLNVLNLLIRSGVDLLAVDPAGDNLFHTLVRLCVEDRASIPTIISMYHSLCALVPVQTLRDMLFWEDAGGLRPIELAAEIGAMEMVRMIFETKGVYLTREEKIGVILYQSYDVTDYEDVTSPRYDKSPLALAATMEEAWVSRMQTGRLMEWAPIRHWYRAKMATNFPLVTLWFIVRLLHFICFLVYDMGVSRIKIMRKAENLNLTSDDYCLQFTFYQASEPANTIITSYVVGQASLVLLFDIIEMIVVLASRRPYSMRCLFKRKDPVVHYVYYRICQASTAFFIIILFCLSTFNTTYGYLVVDYVRLLAVMLASWSLLYFFQLMPSVGYFVVTVQRMLSDLFHFLIIYAIFLLPFAHLFQMFMNENTRQGCIDYFKDVGVGIYSTFTIMLNMIDLRSYNIIGEKAAALYILHFTYVFVIAVLLVNFLIAIMSNSVARVSENRESIMVVERLSVMCLIEFRARWLLRWYYRLARRRHYYHHQGRIYILNKEVMCKYRDPIERIGRNEK